MKSSFYKKSTLEIAKSLLGKYLISRTESGVSIGKIVETEAYLSNDPGSHSFKGKTKRNAQMFSSPGKAYVYLIYGMYNCFNVVTGVDGIGEAVLIRALEPIKGIELMQKRRKTKEIKNLLSGPGKLTQAMGIAISHNGVNLEKGNLKIINKPNLSDSEIIQTTRIGISLGNKLPYRFYIKGNPFVSRKSKNP